MKIMRIIKEGYRKGSRESRPRVSRRKAGVREEKQEIKTGGWWINAGCRAKRLENKNRVRHAINAWPCFCHY